MKQTMRFTAVAAVAAQCLIFGSFAFAQDAAPATAPPAANGAGRGGRGMATPQPPAYEVQPDRTVVFKIRAPQAMSVRLNGDFLQAPPAAPGAPPAPSGKEMTKGEDGVWSVTVKPVDPYCL